MEKLLVVAVHPDDETLGCGGTLIKHKNQGDEIHWIIVSAMTEDLGFQPDVIQRRHHEIQSARDFYSFDSIHE